LLADVERCDEVVFRSIAALGRQAPRPVDAAGRSVDRAEAGAALERLTAALHEDDLSAATGAMADLETSRLAAWADDDLGRLRHSIDGGKGDYVAPSRPRERCGRITPPSGSIQ
jgi:hypothetical protein